MTLPSADTMATMCFAALGGIVGLVWRFSALLTRLRMDIDELKERANEQRERLRIVDKRTQHLSPPRGLPAARPERKE